MKATNAPRAAAWAMAGTPSTDDVLYFPVCVAGPHVCLWRLVEGDVASPQDMLAKVLSCILRGSQPAMRDPAIRNYISEFLI